jgi:hypothetical protein
LPNFAMTDYSSQGRTRPENIVDLSNCRNHQSYYTCLSRSASADGTIILQGFDARQITGGASGYLRQEFRDLELLDEITRLRYNDVLPASIQGSDRNTLLKLYLEWKGSNYVPPNIPPAIGWKSSDYMSITHHSSIDGWHAVSTRSALSTPLVSMQQTSSTLDREKHHKHLKLPEDQNSMITLKHGACKSKRKGSIENPNAREGTLCKRPKLKHGSIDEIKGTIWDSENYSCAYDAMLTCLYALWIEGPLLWTAQWQKLCLVMTCLTSKYEEVHNDFITMEQARDEIRLLLNCINPNHFPYGHEGTSITDLTYQLFQNQKLEVTTNSLCICTNDPQEMNNTYSCILELRPQFKGKLHRFLNHVLTQSQPRPCISCNETISLTRNIVQAPSTIFFIINDADIEVNRIFSFGGQLPLKYVLKAIIYLGSFHYTLRVITNENKVLFHDGIQTQQRLAEEGSLDKFSNGDLLNCRSKKAVLILYALQ